MGFKRPISDLSNVSRGNPFLFPSQSHQLELGYTSFKPGLMSSFYLYYKESFDVIEAYTTLIELDGFNIFETKLIHNGHNLDSDFTQNYDKIHAKFIQNRNKIKRNLGRMIQKPYRMFAKLIANFTQKHTKNN